MTIIERLAKQVTTSTRKMSYLAIAGSYCSSAGLLGSCMDVRHMV
jgi:hypothetical protein